MQKLVEPKFADYIFCFNEKKNKKLKLERGIGFEEIMSILQNGLELDVIHNKNKYSNQKIFVIEKNSYVYAVPYVENSDRHFFLKTIFPNRKLRKRYLTEIETRK